MSMLNLDNVSIRYDDSALKSNENKLYYFMSLLTIITLYITGLVLINALYSQNVSTSCFYLGLLSITVTVCVLIICFRINSDMKNSARGIKWLKKHSNGNIIWTGDHYIYAYDIMVGGKKEVHALDFENIFRSYISVKDNADRNKPLRAEIIVTNNKIDLIVCNV